MTKILVPHGTTPTGFGIKQRRDGSLRALSKCCGRSMERKGSSLLTTAICKGCGANYTTEENTLHCALSNDLPLVEADWSYTGEVYEGWVRNVTGVPDAKLEVVF